MKKALKSGKIKDFRQDILQNISNVLLKNPQMDSVPLLANLQQYMQLEPPQFELKLSA
jgi:hypothetical protein